MRGLVRRVGDVRAGRAFARGRFRCLTSDHSNPLSAVVRLVRHQAHKVYAADDGGQGGQHLHSLDDHHPPPFLALSGVADGNPLAAQKGRDAAKFRSEGVWLARERLAAFR